MLGKILDGRYEILQVLGAGGFGETYLAKDTRRPGNPACVVKHLKPVSRDANSLTTARRLFNSEAETLERLGFHDQIPRLLAYFEENREFYLVQDYIRGHNLTQELEVGKPWHENRVIDLLQDVLPILEFVHNQGVIHRDIKPDNLLRSEQDHKLHLLDFGAVKKIRVGSDPSYTLNQTVSIGTPGYMASEQARGQPRLNSDIYSLGIIAIQALTGTNPSTFNYDSRTGEILWQDLAQTSPELAAIIDKMVRYHFGERYQSATSVLEELAKLSSVEAPTQFQSSTPPESVTPATSITGEKQVQPPIVSITAPESPLSAQKTLAIGSPPSKANLPLPQTEVSGDLVPPSRIPSLLRLGAYIFAIFSASFLLTFAVRNGVSRLRESTQGQGNSGTSEVCTVTASSLNVRASAGGRVVDEVKRGTQVSLTGTKRNNWIEIKQPVSGWVFDRYVNCNLAKQPVVEPAPPQKPEPEKITPDKDSSVPWWRKLIDSLQPEDKPSTPPRRKPITPPPIRETESPPDRKPIPPTTPPKRNPPTPTPPSQPQPTLAQALQKYRSGDIKGAIAIAQSIARNHRDYRNAQANLRLWRDELRATTVYNQAQQALQQKRWDDALAHLNSYFPDSPQWQGKFRKLAAQVRQRKQEERRNQQPPTPTPTPEKPKSPPPPSPEPPEPEKPAAPEPEEPETPESPEPEAPEPESPEDNETESPESPELELDKEDKEED